MDRASFYFTYMHILLVEHQILHSDASLVSIVDAIRGNCRVQILERIAAGAAAARRRQRVGFNEDIDIYLAYQYKLRESLALPIPTSLEFDGIANITDEQIDNAKQAVLEAEKSDFMRYWLTESALWSATLKKWNAEKTAAAKERYIEAMRSDSFKTAVASALVEKGLAVDDVDAERSISSAGRAIMVSAAVSVNSRIARRQAVPIVTQWF